MKKKAIELKKGDVVSIAGAKGKIIETETSDIGKHGKRKCRLVIELENKEKAIIIRPEDYSFDIL